MTDLLAFSLRGACRAYGISRDTLAFAVYTGELPAARLGSRRLVITRHAIEEWLARHPVATGHDPAAVVDRVMERTHRTET